MGDLETVTGGHGGEVAVQLVAGGEADRVDDAIQAIPLLRQRGEHGFDLGVIGDIARKAQLGIGTPAGGEFFDATLELLVLVGEGQLGAFAVHGRGDAGGDGQLAGDADDENALTGEKSHGFFLFCVESRAAARG